METKQINHRQLAKDLMRDGFDKHIAALNALTPQEVAKVLRYVLITSQIVEGSVDFFQFIEDITPYLRPVAAS